MCAGLRLGSKDSSGSGDYFLLSLKKNNPTTTGIIPLCRVRVHPTVFKAEVVRHQTVGPDSHSTRLGLQVTTQYLWTAGVLGCSADTFQEASKGIICIKTDTGLKQQLFPVGFAENYQVL